MIKSNFIKRYQKILLKWKNYKSLRSCDPCNCQVGHPNFLDWKQREQMFEDLLAIIDLSKDD